MGADIKYPICGLRRPVPTWGCSAISEKEPRCVTLPFPEGYSPPEARAVWEFLQVLIMAVSETVPFPGLSRETKGWAALSASMRLPVRSDNAAPQPSSQAVIRQAVSAARTRER